MPRWTKFFGFSYLASFCAVLAVGQEHTKDTVETIQKNLAQKKAVLVDVREKDEWDAGHLKGAQLVPLSQLKSPEDAKAATKNIDPKSIIYCHCKAGRRALMAADLLRKQGYEVRPLKQGFEELVKAGLPQAKSDDKGK